MITETSLIPHQSMVALVATYQQAKKEISQAFGLLEKAKIRLHQAGIEDSVLTPNVRDYIHIAQQPKSTRPSGTINGSVKPNILISAGTKKEPCIFTLSAWTWSSV